MIDEKTRHLCGSPPSMTTATAPFCQLALAFVLSLVVLCSLIRSLQNVHIFTTNRMYNAIQAEPWIADPGRASLDSSNYLYFPLYGALARGLDALGILRGVAWQQFAYLNAVWASLAVVFIYAFIYRVTANAWAAVLAACFHLGSGYFLLLSVINEDIMPGYALVLGPLVLAGLWFDRPTDGRVGVVGLLFTLGWLIEWRRGVPALPALMLALVLSDGRPLQRLRRIGTLPATVLVVSGFVQLLWAGPNGAVGLLDILWTGKGVLTGWAGLSWEKAWRMLSGGGNYFLLLGGWVDPLSPAPGAVPLARSVARQTASVLC